MKAVALAAGKSTRLYPLTATLPKCLLPIDDKTILDHQVESLVQQGIDELILVVGCYKQKIIDHLAAKNYPLTTTYIDNPDYEHTHPITSLWCAREYLVGPLVFFHSDVLFDQEAIQALLTDPHETALLYRKNVWDAEAGKIVVDAHSYVRELGKHIEQNRASGEYLQIAKFGAHFCTRLTAVLDERVRAGRDGYTIDAFNDVVQHASITALGLSFNGLAQEIDTPEDYATAQRAWQERRAS